MVQNKFGRFFLLAFFISSFCLKAEPKPPVKYWINFTNKNNTPFKVNEPLAFVTQKSIDRRLKYNIQFDASDLPVSPDYLSKVASVPNVRLLYASKWLNGVVIQFDSVDLAIPALSTISSFSFVVSSKTVQKYNLSLGTPAENAPIAFQKNNEVTSSTTLTSTFSYGGSGAQIRQLSVDCLHERGYRGQGITIGVLDAGFGYVDTNPIFDSIRARGGIIGTRDFVSGGNYAYQGSTHGSMVFSCLAANAPGLIVGTAPMADYWLFRTEAPAENISEEYNWIRGAEFADSVGVDILTTSLGYTEFDDPSMNHNYEALNGRTAPMSIAATMAARKGMLVFNAAGNERANPWHFISVPSDADSIISVGAIDSVGKEAAFSSVGPTSDGRIKPDFVAIGAGSWVSATNLTCFPANGTSFATPILAGAVACYWQANRHKNNIRLIRDMKDNASNSDLPNNRIGWGVPDLCPNLPFDFEVALDRDKKLIFTYLTESDYSNIKIEMVDLNGRRLFYSDMNANDRNFILDSAAFPDGIYILKVQTSNGGKSKKIALGDL